MIPVQKETGLLDHRDGNDLNLNLNNKVDFEKVLDIYSWDEHGCIKDH